MKLTERKIKYLEPGEGRQILWENGGFGVQMTADGEKTFVLEYRFDEMTKMVTLGTYPEMSLDDARVEAVKVFDKIINGIDPEEESAAQPSSADSPVKEEKPPEEEAAPPEEEAKAEEEATPPEEEAKEPPPEEEGEEEQPAEEKEKPPEVKTTPARAPSLITKFLKKTPEEETAPPEGEATPPAEPPKQLELIKEGEPILRKNDLKLFLSRLPNSEMSPANQLAFKMLLFTAQDHEALVSAKWTDIDLSAKRWTIPKNFSKNGKKHRVPLTKTAMDSLIEIKKLAGYSGALFPSKGGGASIAPKELVDDLHKTQLRFGVDAFTPKEVQRCVIHNMTEIGIPNITVGKIINHEELDEAAKADQKSDDREKLDALKEWDKKLKSDFF